MCWSVRFKCNLYFAKHVQPKKNIKPLWKTLYATFLNLKARQNAKSAWLRLLVTEESHHMPALYLSLSQKEVRFYTLNWKYFTAATFNWMRNMCALYLLEIFVSSPLKELSVNFHPRAVVEKTVQYLPSWNMGMDAAQLLIHQNANADQQHVGHLQ